MRALIVEDSERLRDVVSTALRKSGYIVDDVGEGDHGWFLLQNNRYDVVLLDIMLPNLDGLSILGRLRESGDETPVLILSAKSQIKDRVLGLDSGADDYLIKPFDLEELIARVKVLSRRNSSSRATVLKVDDLEVNTSAKTVTRSNKPINLSAREFAVLEILIRNVDRVVSRTTFDEQFYEDGVLPMSNVIDVVVCSIRRKIGFGGKLPNLIHTRRGMGYIMTSADEVH
ncbi:MAG: response regulator transcription factor [Verrucomicrobiales bacterium]|nr:response regulator transcription factor [Verrucomicrobiales bacterium]